MIWRDLPQRHGSLPLNDWLTNRPSFLSTRELVHRIAEAMTGPHLLLLHGWGFDSTMWRDMSALLPAFRLTSWDRGYFGAPTMPAAEPPLIAVGHSLGALVLAAHLPMSVPLVAINGFDRFTGEDAIAFRVLARMRRRFAQAPAVVLDEFRERCGAPPAASAFDEAVLAADLNQLSTARVADYGRRMLVLHGAADPILPPAMRQAVFAGAPRAIHAGAGHLLPVTHPAWCAEQIEAFACA